jgi:NADPH2:quinone reductase
MKAIRIHGHGGPDVLVYEDVDIDEPGPGEVRVRNQAIGVNFVDIYLRTGATPALHPGQGGGGRGPCSRRGRRSLRPGRSRGLCRDARGQFFVIRRFPCAISVTIPIESMFLQC